MERHVNAADQEDCMDCAVISLLQDLMSDNEEREGKATAKV